MRGLCDRVLIAVDPQSEHSHSRCFVKIWFGDRSLKVAE